MKNISKSLFPLLIFWIFSHNLYFKNLPLWNKLTGEKREKKNNAIDEKIFNVFRRDKNLETTKIRAIKMKAR